MSDDKLNEVLDELKVLRHAQGTVTEEVLRELRVLRRHQHDQAAEALRATGRVIGVLGTVVEQLEKIVAALGGQPAAEQQPTSEPMLDFEVLESAAE